MINKGLESHGSFTGFSESPIEKIEVVMCSRRALSIPWSQFEDGAVMARAWHVRI
jgi:hypothetical protein